MVHRMQESSAASPFRCRIDGSWFVCGGKTLRSALLQPSPISLRSFICASFALHRSITVLYDMSLIISGETWPQCFPFPRKRSLFPAFTSLVAICDICGKNSQSPAADAVCDCSPLLEQIEELGLCNHWHVPRRLWFPRRQIYGKDLLRETIVIYERLMQSKYRFRNRVLETEMS